MSINNFDISSEFVNLELNIFRDDDLQAIFFNENLTPCDDFNGTSLLHDNYRNVQIYVFTGGTMSCDIDFNSIDLYNFKCTPKKTLQNFIKGDFFKTELNNICNNYFGKSFSKLNKNELIEFILNEFISSDYIKFFIDECQPKFNVFSLYGYSQGDYIEIIILDELLKDYNFKNYDEFYNSMHEYINNLCYDAPISASLRIDGDEFCFDNYRSHVYKYSKFELINIARQHLPHDKKTYILAWLDHNLGEFLGYN